MRRSAYLLVLACCLCREAHGQLQDSVTPGTNFRRAAKEFALGELTPYAVDRWVLQKDYARISFQTVGHNLSPASWTWDDDGFQTNQIGHPYHGSLFFNALRSNGYSFWQSVPATWAGSYLWETFAENQAPAPNDFINTGFGGIVLGEMTHRLTGKLLNSPGHGVKRQAAEVLSLLINPMNGLNRLLNGQWGKPLPYGTPVDNTPVSIELDAGLRKYNVNAANPFYDGHFGLYGRIRLVYGDAFTDLRTPFAHLTILAEMGQDDSSKISIVNVYGSLIGWRLYTGKFRHVAVLSANYDYINNSAFMYSAQSVRANLFSDFPVNKKIGIHTSLGFGPVLLAAVPNSYLYNTRDYDYGPGMAFNGAARLSIAGILSYSVNYRGGWMYTVSGNATSYYLHAITNEVSVRIVKEVSLSAESGSFNLHGNYRHFDTVDKTYPYLRLSIRYNPIFF